MLALPAVLHSQVAGIATAPTVLERFQSLATSLALKTVSGATDKKIGFVPEKNTSFKRELDLSLQAALKRETSLELFEPAGADSFAVLEVDLRAATLTYQRLPAFFGNGGAARKFEMTLFIKVLSAEKEVRIAKEISETLIDTVRSGDVPLLEDRRFVQTQAVLPLQFFDNAFVPAVIAAAAGVIIYLFFAVRSR